jgi:hypothetical protein
LYFEQYPEIINFYQPYASERGYSQQEVAFFHYHNYYCDANVKSLWLILGNKHTNNYIFIYDNYAYFIDKTNISKINDSDFQRLPYDNRNKISSIKIRSNIEDISGVLGSAQNLQSIVYKNVTYDVIQYKYHTPFFFDDSDIAKYMIDVNELVINFYDHEPQYKLFKAHENTKNSTTIITLTSPFKDMPDTTCISASLKSIRQFNEMHESPSIIVADGIRTTSDWKHSDYQQYKENLTNLIDKNIYPFNNTILLESDGWNGPMRNLVSATNLVSTKYTFLNQHDLVLFDKHKNVWSNINQQIMQNIFTQIIDSLNNPKVQQVIFPRMWELIDRQDFILNNKYYKINMDQPTQEETAYYHSHPKPHPNENTIRQKASWWKFTNQDLFILGALKIFNVLGYSDAPSIVKTDFLKQKLIPLSKNNDRFLEDQIHSNFKKYQHYKYITDYIYIAPLFTCDHVDLKSKNNYVGRGIDEY